MEFDFGNFGRRSSAFGTDIFGKVVEGSLTKTTRYNLKLPETRKELLELQVPIRARARTFKVLGVQDAK